MKIYRLEAKQSLAISLETAWDFFSDPRNLSVITPPSLGFKITCDLPPRMYAGMIITYTVTPLLGIPVTWVTEITHVHEPHLFVDEQRVGPYKLWHHQHRFKEVAGGVEATDIVHYALPLGPLGWAVHDVLVRRQLAEIFAFRRQVLKKRFGAITGARLKS